jgi:serine phosphatase RsbU (regulator of sigma subunit)
VVKFPETKFEVQVSLLENGDLLLAYTDGIPDRQQYLRIT